MSMADGIKKYVFENKLMIKDAKQMLDFFNSNTSEGPTIYHYTENLTFSEFVVKTKKAIEIITAGRYLNNKSSWNDFYSLIQKLLTTDITETWSEDEFQIDLVTLTLEALIEYKDFKK